MARGGRRSLRPPAHRLPIQRMANGGIPKPQAPGATPTSNAQGGGRRPKPFALGYAPPYMAPPQGVASPRAPPRPARDPTEKLPQAPP
eukprot:2298480-Pyramimonas_sp.AAC.1